MPRPLRLPFLCAAVSVTFVTLAGCSGSTSSPVSPIAGARESRSALSLLPTVLQSALPVAPTNAPAVTETPLAADSLADSVGVNTHVGTYATAADFPLVVSLTHRLHVRHLRDGILDADAPYDTAMTTMLASSGAKLDGITDCTGIEYYPQSPTSPSDIQQFDSAIGGRLEVVEGPNEVDQRGDANWAADTKACLPGLRSAEPLLPFYAPSISDQLDDAPVLGNISSLVDYGNMHRYFSGRNPGTAGWGGTFTCGVYGALAWAICETQIDSATKPIVVTETGYDSQAEVDEVTQAKYLSRLFFVNMQAGISRSYVYVLKDYQGDFGGDGLIRADDTLKPSYAAIAAEIGLFGDPGIAPLVRRALTYSVTAQSSSIQHLLFEKNDGSYVLALWNETPSWDPNAKQDIIVPAQPVAVTFASAPQHTAAQALDDAGVLQPAVVTTASDTVNVAVDDHMTFLSFRL